MRLRGRISIVGAVSAAGVLAFAIVPAAGVAKPKKVKTNPNLVNCVAKVSVEPLATPPPTSIAQPDQAFPGQTPGKQWGKIHCSKGIGAGLEELSYKIPASGDEVGSFVAYFSHGTIKGKFDLGAQEASIVGCGGSDGQLGCGAYGGPLKHLSATGSLAGTLNGGGQMANCTSQDGVHFKCKELL